MIPLGYSLFKNTFTKGACFLAPKQFPLPQSPAGGENTNHA